MLFFSMCRIGYAIDFEYHKLQDRLMSTDDAKGYTVALNKKLLQIEYLNEIANEIKHSHSKEFIKNKLSYLLEFYDLLNFSFNYETPYFRARKTINGKPYLSTSDTYYPPNNLTNAGRLNEKGDSFLYLSMSLDTALSEINATDGDIVQVSAYVTKRKSLTLGVIGEFYRSSRGSASLLDKAHSFKISNFVRELSIKDRGLALSFLYTDLFFDEILRSPDAVKNEYIHSRTLSKLIFEKYPFLDGLIYHSVASAANFNLGLPNIKADAAVALKSTMLMKIKKRYPYGLYDIEPYKTPIEIKKNGDILWG